MIDLTFIAANLAFFFISIAYASGCEHLRGGKHREGDLHA